METVEELDVRVMPPIRRHEKLNKLFDQLPVGASFIFINDHDPKPLYYEFQSRHGSVVDWEYLNTGGREWKVKVTRKAASVSKDMEDISTLIDLRTVAEKDVKHTVFHRFGMMELNDVMELISEGYPSEIKEIFDWKFAGEFDWKYVTQDPLKVVAHITKLKVRESKEDIKLIEKFDLRPFPPAKRHDIVYENFEKIQSGEGFIITNDHDPKPLYYQLEAENDIPFEWEYIIAGPEVWKIKISKS